MATQPAKYFEKAQIRLTGETPEQALEAFAERPSTELATLIVNHKLNELISDYTDSFLDRKTDDAHIPFHGWFWRAVDFFSPNGVTIARDGDAVAVTMNNKWGFPERYLTAEEQAEFRRLVWKAHRIAVGGGALTEITQGTKDALEEAGAFIEGLTIEEDE